MNNIRDQILEYAVKIEDLSKNIQSTVFSNGDPLADANELVQHSSTLTFLLGEMHALETVAASQVRTLKNVKTTTVSDPNRTVNRNFYNIRDSSGRFTRSLV